MYVNYEQMSGKIPYPKGSMVALLGENEEDIKDSLKGYLLTEKIEEGVRFACIVQGNNYALNAYNSSLKNTPFCLVGKRPEKVFLDDVLWHTCNPFTAGVNEPSFVIKNGEDKKEDLEFCVRFAFALAEKITREILLFGEAKTCFPQDFSSVDFITKNSEEVFSYAFALKGQVDGLKQTESALTLLKTKEKNVFNRYDSVVLLAKYLAKVYNYYVRYKPTSIFAPDNNMRAEMLEEFFGVKNAKLRKVLSEYEIRKRYYMIAQHSDFLLYLWDKVCLIIDECFAKHRNYTEDNGFCLEEISEDIKFSAFLSPDILHGETLLSFIKDCGVADAFI